MNPSGSQHLRYVKDPWNGKERLWKVFWLYNLVLGYAMIMGISHLPEGALKAAGNLFILIYFIWVAVSLWRCAYNVDNELWGHLARALVVFSVIGFFLPGVQSG
jgi:hypothetical protein